MNPAAEVLYEVRGAVAVITINRPDQLNAINNAVCEQLTAALRRRARNAAQSHGQIGRAHV